MRICAVSVLTTCPANGIVRVLNNLLELGSRRIAALGRLVLVAVAIFVLVPPSPLLAPMLLLLFHFLQLLEAEPVAVDGHGVVAEVGGLLLVLFARGGVGAAAGAAHVLVQHDLVGGRLRPPYSS